MESLSSKIRRRSFLVVAAVLCVAPMASAVRAGEVVNTGYFGDVAILGYDTVAYFTEGRAIKGTPEFTKQWLGATWHFASAAHRDAFAANPISYAPQYGGFCAAGVSLEEASANIDPQAWRIVDGKLYLFSGNEGLDKDFDADPEAVIEKADLVWHKIGAEEFAARARNN
jgi:YHS domain-containing protein